MSTKHVCPPIRYIRPSKTTLIALLCSPGLAQRRERRREKRSILNPPPPKTPSSHSSDSNHSSPPTTPVRAFNPSKEKTHLGSPKLSPHILLESIELDNHEDSPTHKPKKKKAKTAPTLNLMQNFQAKNISKSRITVSSRQWQRDGLSRRSIFTALVDTAKGRPKGRCVQ